MSLKKFTLNWDLHKWPSDTNWTPESHGSQLASCLVHCCHGNIICDPTNTSVFAVIKAEALLARKNTLYLPHLDEKPVSVKVHSQ